MGFDSAQVTVSATTPTPLIVQGNTNTTFLNVAGTIGDPIPFVLYNSDSTNSVYLGGPNVTLTNGLVLAPGQSITIQVTDSGVPYGLASGGTPKIAILAGRQ